MKVVTGLKQDRGGACCRACIPLSHVMCSAVVGKLDCNGTCTRQKQGGQQPRGASTLRMAAGSQTSCPLPQPPPAPPRPPHLAAGRDDNLFVGGTALQHAGAQQHAGGGGQSDDVRGAGHPPAPGVGVVPPPQAGLPERAVLAVLHGRAGGAGEGGLCSAPAAMTGGPWPGMPGKPAQLPVIMPVIKLPAPSVPERTMKKRMHTVHNQPCSSPTWPPAGVLAGQAVAGKEGGG